MKTVKKSNTPQIDRLVDDLQGGGFGFVSRENCRKVVAIIVTRISEERCVRFAKATGQYSSRKLDPVYEKYMNAVMADGMVNVPRWLADDKVEQYLEMGI